MSVRSTPGATVMGIGALDSGTIVRVNAPGSIAWILPWVAKCPPSGMTFVIVGLDCAAAGADSIRGVKTAAHASAIVSVAAREGLHAFISNLICLCFLIGPLPALQPARRQCDPVTPCGHLLHPAEITKPTSCSGSLPRP